MHRIMSLDRVKGSSRAMNISLRNEYFMLSAAVIQERGGAQRMLEAWRSAKQGTMN